MYSMYSMYRTILIKSYCQQISYDRWKNVDNQFSTSESVPLSLILKI